jgi:hypothetical protein
MKHSIPSQMQSKAPVNEWANRRKTLIRRLLATLSVGFACALIR